MGSGIREPGHRRLGFLSMTGKPAPEYEANDEPASRPDRGAVLDANRARQSVPLGRMRYVLAISLALVIIGFVVLYLLLRP